MKIQDATLKKRSSIYKAEWSNTREGHYRKKCDEIIFRKKLELIITGDQVYLNAVNEKSLLAKIDKPGAMWYEIWVKLKEI